jgi:hypothetical protein
MYLKHSGLPHSGKQMIGVVRIECRTTTREGVFGCRLKGNIYSGESGWPGLVVHELFRTLF